MVCPSSSAPGQDLSIADAVADAQDGDMEAIQFLYQRYKNNVYGYVLSILRDPQEAEDVTQQVFTKLILVIGKYQPHSSFTSWLMRVARNTALDQLRRRRPVPVAEVYEANKPEDDTSRERRSQLRDALDLLPEDQRRVVVLRHLVGLSPTEIADQLDRTEAAIHGLHHRALRSLRRELQRAHCAPSTLAA